MKQLTRYVAPSMQLARCKHMGAIGMSTKYICAETGLSPSQVVYCLHKENIRRKDYRDGKSDVAKYVVNLLKKRLFIRMIE